MSSDDTVFIGVDTESEIDLFKQLLLIELGKQAGDPVVMVTGGLVPNR